MKQRRRPFPGHAAAQPCGGFRKPRRMHQIGHRGPTADPAFEGSAWKPRRTTERFEADLRRIDGVQGGKALDQQPAQRRAGSRAAHQARRQSAADDQPGAVFDDLKRRAEDARLGAIEQGAGRQRVSPPQRGKNAVLARHVVGPARQRTAGRPAQNSRPAIDRNQIVEIAEAAGELPRRLRTEPRAAPGQVATQRSPVLRDRFRFRSELSPSLSCRHDRCSQRMMCRRKPVCCADLCTSRPRRQGRPHPVWRGVL